MKSNQKNLITSQKEILQKIYSQGENLWKILIFDNFNRTINSSLYKMKDLRENNITLYFNLKDHRQQLHGVTPTIENIEIIVSDFEEDLYSSVVVHFSSEPAPHLLNNFAKNLAKTKASSISKLSKIEYSCLGFHTIDRMMSVASQNNELLNILSVVKGKPIFIYGAKEEQQAQLLKDRYMNSIAAENQNDLVIKEPFNIVLFFNRELDYFPVLSHGITYASLMENIYKISSNGQRIRKNKDTVMEIDLNDEIWVQRKLMLVNEMQLEKQFNAIKTKMLSEKSEKQKLDQHNQLSEKHKKVQLHIHNAQELIKEASKRRLNEFHEVEMQIYKKRVLSHEIKRDIDMLLEQTDNVEDKIRLVLIILLYCQHVEEKQIQEFESKVPSIKSNKFYKSIKEKTFKGSSQSQNTSGKYIKKFAKGFWNNLTTNNKFMLSRYIEKIRQLKENEIKQMGLNISYSSEVPHNCKIANIIVYCCGGICFNEEADLVKHDNRVIYVGDRLVSAKELLQLN